jgi:hypothetical protein
MISFSAFSEFDMTTDNGLIELHKQCFHNRTLLSAAKNCGCFYCLKTFAPNQIVKWVDEDQTALCPFCEIDAVLGFDTEAVDPAILSQMHEHWFERTIRLTADGWQEALRSNSWPPDLSTRKQQ